MYAVQYSEDCEHHGRENTSYLEEAAAFNARLHNGLIHGDPDHDCARVIEFDVGATQREVLDA